MLLKRIWSVMFVVFYPALVVFSLLFTGVLLVFSWISQLLFKLLNAVDKKSTTPSKGNS